MIREITLGQYYPVKSNIHSLDPRVKLLGTLIYIISLFIADKALSYGICVAALIAVTVMSHVPFSYLFRGLKPVIIILLISVCFNLFLTEGEVLISFWIFSITREGLILAIFMGIRLICLIIGASLLTFTTMPNQLTDGIEKSLGFLTVLRIPVHEIAMMISIALRFIPILTEELDKIMKAQMSRGADFESGNFIRRAKSMVPLLVPLFVSAFRTAGDLAGAMEARCYHGGKGRTKMHPLKYKKQDCFACLFLVLYLAACILIRIFL